MDMIFICCCLARKFAILGMSKWASYVSNMETQQFTASYVHVNHHKYQLTFCMLGWRWCLWLTTKYQLDGCFGSQGHWLLTVGSWEKHSQSHPQTWDSWVSEIFFSTSCSEHCSWNMASLFQTDTFHLKSEECLFSPPTMFEKHRL